MLFPSQGDLETQHLYLDFPVKNKKVNDHLLRAEHPRNWEGSLHHHMHKLHSLDFQPVFC